MKIIRIFIVIFTIGLVFNCSKDDDGDNGGTTEPTVVIDRSANLRATGESANDILSNDNFDRLLIEIAYVTGFRPTQEAMDNFVQYLRERTFKETIDMTFTELPSPAEEDLSLQEIAELEQDNRTAFNEGTTLSIYIYFADAPSEDDDDAEGLVTLGAVYRNTSMVIYESTVRQLAARSIAISNADVESATLNHEFGHLFGLVNLSDNQGNVFTPSVNDHEDPDAQNHCVVEGCLMRAELQFGGGMLKMLEANKASKGVATVDLDPECILDLQANGGR